ncbi:unnamed protein product [Linum tenue]|uniref:Complex III subunit 9 n=1 Tax=Linum tenue TaxID=586396 RepID=A0AAV0I2R9_9ROSI|nr:unnamed protein product [Linum tenue]
MEYVPRRAQSGLFEGIYKVFMRRTSVYATFVLAGAFFGERPWDADLNSVFSPSFSHALDSCGLWSSQVVGVQQCWETL